MPVPGDGRCILRLFRLGASSRTDDTLSTAQLGRHRSGLAENRLTHFSPTTAFGGIAMKRTIALLAAITLFVVSSEYAESVGSPGGTWPKSWPNELEPLRKQAWTWVQGQVENTACDIPFANREEFECAWPYILSLKSEGAPITLRRGPHLRVEGTNRRRRDLRARLFLSCPLLTVLHL